MFIKLWINLLYCCIIVFIYCIFVFFFSLFFPDCEECLTLFQDQSDLANISGPSFILDFPTSMGVSQRALLTLPYGLMIGRSSIPRAGVGVINHGPVVSPGMHFGPFEGEVTTSENAMASNFSWEVSSRMPNWKLMSWLVVIGMCVVLTIFSFSADLQRKRWVWVHWCCQGITLKLDEVKYLDYF